MLPYKEVSIEQLLDLSSSQISKLSEFIKLEMFSVEEESVYIIFVVLSMIPLSLFTFVTWVIWNFSLLYYLAYIFSLVPILYYVLLEIGYVKDFSRSESPEKYHITRQLLEYYRFKVQRRWFQWGIFIETVMLILVWRLFSLFLSVALLITMIWVVVSTCYRSRKLSQFIASL